MITFSDKVAQRQFLAGTGSTAIDEAGLNLLRALQDITDDQSDGEESRMQSPMVAHSRAREAASPGSSFYASPIHSEGRNRIRASGPPRTLQNSASVPVMSRSVDPAVCRGSRGERLRNVGQSMLMQDFAAQHAQQASQESFGSSAELRRTPYGGGAFPSNSFISRDAHDSSEDWPNRRNRNRDQQWRQNEAATSKDDWPRHRERKKIAESTPYEDPSPTRLEYHRQPRATGAAASGSSPGASEDRRAKDELEALRHVHQKTVEELAEASRHLAWATTELHCQSPQPQPEPRLQHDEELSNLRSKLREVKSERDQQKTELQLARQQSRKAAHAEEQVANLQAQLSQARAEKDQLRSDLRAAQDQLPVKDALLEKVQNILSEQEQEKRALQKAVSGYSSFTNRMIHTSARPVLDDALDITNAELLGTGHYGYILTCSSRGSKNKVVLKLQDIRWVDVAVREWAQGEEVGKHPHIAELKELFVHSDSDHAIQTRIVASFKDASAGIACNQPTSYPNAYICLVSEYMDCGSVSSFMEKQLLTLEGVCAVTRQVASALVFMHQREQNHNDLKPENVMLKRAAHGNTLIVKLADVGFAEHSADHTRDQELLAYNIWCMVAGRDFSRCPPKNARHVAMAEFQKASLLGRSATTRSSALIETVIGLWNEKLDIPVVACNAEFGACEVRGPLMEDMKKKLTACANFEVTKRASVLLERFQCCGHKAPLANADLSTIDSRTEPLAALEEGLIPVLDSRDR